MLLFSAIFTLKCQDFLVELQLFLMERSTHSNVEPLCENEPFFWLLFFITSSYFFLWETFPSKSNHTIFMDQLEINVSIKLSIRKAILSYVFIIV